MLPVPAVLKANILAKMRMGEQQILRVSEAHIFERGTYVEHALNGPPPFLSGFFTRSLRPLQLLVLAPISFDLQHNRFPYVPAMSPWIISTLQAPTCTEHRGSLSAEGAILDGLLRRTDIIGSELSPYRVASWRNHSTNAAPLVATVWRYLPLRRPLLLRRPFTFTAMFSCVF